jgi:hypothetical protein
MTWFSSTLPNAVRLVAAKVALAFVIALFTAGERKQNQNNFILMAETITNLEQRRSNPLLQQLQE